MSKKTRQLKFDQAHYVLFFLIIVNIVACFNMLRPYLNAIIIATILAIILGPLHQRIEKKLKNRRNLAALTSCTLLTVVIILPVSIFLISILNQGIHSFNAIQAWIAAGNFENITESRLVITIVDFADTHLPFVLKKFANFDLSAINFEEISLQASSAVGKSLMNQTGQIVANMTTFMGKFCLMIFSFYFLIRDQDEIFEKLLHLVPLSTSQEEKIMHKITEVAKSALLGTFVTALAQGIVGGIAFFICGLPGLFWGAAMAFASLIPVVGTALIWIPATGYLFLSGRLWPALFMMLWCSIIVGMIDNFVRPLFMSGSAGMSTFLIFFSILGGLNYFGLIGLLYGPLIFGLTMVLFYIYDLEFSDFLDQQDKS